MTDRTDPQRPRTEAITSLHNGIREAHVLGLSDVTVTLDAAILLRDLAIEAEAATLAAPAGLREALLSLREEVGRIAFAEGDAPRIAGQAMVEVMAVVLAIDARLAALAASPETKP